MADISFTVPGYTPGRFVLPKIAEFPLLGDTSEQTSIAFNRIASKYPQFNAEHQDVHVLAYFTHGPGLALNTKRPVTKLEEMQGLKWRIGGGLVNDIAAALGMNATLKPATDTYELLSGGVMDGTLFTADAIEGWKLDKLAKHTTVFPGGLYNTSFVLMMNKAQYEKLSPEEKLALDAISGETAARIMGSQWDKADRRGMALLKTNNAHVVKADAAFTTELKQRSARIEAQWAEQAKTKGLPDPEKVLAELRAEIAKLAK